MTDPKLKEQVEHALKQEWSDFAREHPRLAEVLDESLLVEHLARSIADDPEYQESMRAAATIGSAGEMVSDLLTKLVRRALRMLA